jgi:hypothetical protein
MTMSQSTRAAADTAWTNPLPRTYFVGGHRVEHLRNALGQSSWICDCVDYVRGQQCGGEHWCQHAERVAAAAELDRLLQTPKLFLHPGNY